MAWWYSIQEGVRDNPFEAYARHLETIRKRLPPDFLALQESLQPLHDSDLRELHVDIKERQLSLRLDADDGKGGLRVYQLIYLDVSAFFSLADPEVGFPAPHGYGRLGYDEADVTPSGEIEHRILFSSGIEFVIRFYAGLGVPNSKTLEPDLRELG
jgi:hypothetical protein